MNDRFKFRVWDKENNRYEDDLYYEAGDLQVACVNKIFEEYISDGRIIEQCTGLKDKNGEPIYDGDIVTDGEDNGRIYWKNTGWACTMFLWQKKPEELEVIGNIHYNPELLEG